MGLGGGGFAKEGMVRTVLGRLWLSFGRVKEVGCGILVHGEIDT